jgi:hypothetical protein
MNTKLLMTLSALAMGIAGIILSFMPYEILHYISDTSSPTVEALVLQVLGALYFGFAIMNWTAKANLIGGIYGRPIAIGNFTHFTIASLALTKGYFLSHDIIVLVATLIYAAFAISFTIVFFRHPASDREN